MLKEGSKILMCSLEDVSGVMSTSSVEVGEPGSCFTSSSELIVSYREISMYVCLSHPHSQLQGDKYVRMFVTSS